MTEDRRYDEHEIEQIFESAAAPARPARSTASARGLTLEELQAIGHEVGLPPARIAQAAANVDRRRQAGPRRTSLGMPTGVGRTVELPRPLSDREWALLVAELRDTFSAVGRDVSAGEFRQWVNGRLHACVEPTLNGWRLRLGTVKGDAAAVNSLGFGGIVLALAVTVSTLAAGEPATGGAVLGGLSGGVFGFNAWRLRRWSEQRERQMNGIVERVHAIIDAGRHADG